MIRLKIDDKVVLAPEGTTILNAALKAGIHIPHLCYMEMPEIGYKNDCASCRVCVVEVKGMNRLLPSCTTPVAEGMEVITNSLKVMQKKISSGTFTFRSPKRLFNLWEEWRV